MAEPPAPLPKPPSPYVDAVLFGVALLIVALTVLSELGVNIAPLLAGAGVVGIAIGFGSQKLVQDLINGLFLPLENAVQVGDTVTLGGQSGTVEALSIRTIRLRALDGGCQDFDVGEPQLDATSQRFEVRGPLISGLAEHGDDWRGCGRQHGPQATGPV